MGLKRIPVAVSARVDKKNESPQSKTSFAYAREIDRTRHGSSPREWSSVACGSSFPRFAEQRFALGAHDVQVIRETSTRALSRHHRDAGGHGYLQI